MDLSLAMAVLGMVGSGGVAVGVTKAAISSTRERIVSIDTTLKDHAAADLVVQLDTVDRLARIETKIDAILADEE